MIGDTANAKDMDGKPLPGLAPVAKREGTYVAKVIAVRAAGQRELAPFAYRSFGNLATIGFRNRVFVAMDWAYLTYERGARLITESISTLSSAGNPE